MKTLELSSKKVEDLTEEEIEQLLEQKRKEKIKAEQKRKQQYEKTRDNVVVTLCEDALLINNKLEKFKESSFEQLNEFRFKMLEYGDVKEDSKGNMTLFSLCNRFKIIYSRQIRKGFDERANMAEKKMKEYLETAVKVRDKKSYNLIQSLMERNEKTGDFDMALIGRLIKHEDEIDHPLFNESIKLFKQSYNEVSTKDYVRFYEQEPNGNYKLINLQFSSI